MNLYLMRHGIAAPQNAAGVPSDGERPLTPKGAKRIHKAAQGLGAVNAVFDRILTSPLPRARQTAQIVAELFNMQNHVEEIPQLAPEGTVQDLISCLAAYRDRKGLLLVGHQPLLGATAGLLLRPGGELHLELKKGGLCCVKVKTFATEQPAELRWLLTAKQLRRLGAS